MTTLFDTGPLVAAADQDDDRHQECRALLNQLSGPFLVPLPVLPEVCHFLCKWGPPAAEKVFLEECQDGSLTVVPFLASDLRRATELVRQYEDFPLGFVDASVVATAERLGIERIATLNRKHFSAVRPRHLEAFHLLP